MVSPVDAHYVDLRADLDSDAQDLELESWSLLVDAPYLRTHPKEVAKRQDIIYGEPARQGARPAVNRATMCFCEPVGAETRPKP